MREATVRWALGAVAALLGAVARFVGGLLVPRQGAASFSDVIRYLIVAIPIALLGFCLALGLTNTLGQAAQAYDKLAKEML